MKPIKHFTFHELIKSNPDVNKIIYHLPKDFAVIQNLLTLASTLDKVRELFDAPILVNSGYRSKQYNLSVQGSAPNSFHILGRAADIRANDLERLRNVVLLFCGFTHEDKRLGKNYVIYENEDYEVLIYNTFIHFAIKK